MPKAPAPARREIYDNSGVDHLRNALQSFVNGGRRSPAGCVRSIRSSGSTPTPWRWADPRLSYGFVAGPGTFETTLTRPDLFAGYYLEQFRLLLENHSVELEIGTSAQPIPVHFSLRRERPHRGQPDAGAAPAAARPVRPARPRRDGRRHRQRHLRRRARASRGRWRCSPRRASTIRCIACATTPAPTPEHFQNFVLFTNYQFYIDEFVRLGHETMAEAATAPPTTPSSSRAT
mgnify:CR=1 FL=1